MTTLERLESKLGNHLLTSTTNGEERVHDVVEGWNWNLNIFEIYDDIKEWRETDIRAVCKYAYKYFNKDVMFNELAWHLTGEGIKD